MAAGAAGGGEVSAAGGGASVAWEGAALAATAEKKEVEKDKYSIGAMIAILYFASNLHNIKNPIFFSSVGHSQQNLQHTCFKHQIELILHVLSLIFPMYCKLGSSY